MEKLIIMSNKHFIQKEIPPRRLGVFLPRGGSVADSVTQFIVQHCRPQRRPRRFNIKFL